MSAHLAERRAFLEGCAAVDVTADLALVRVSGGDAFDYLQRSVSSDLRKLEAGRGQRSTLLTNKGKMIAAFDLFQAGEGFLLVVERAAAADLVEGLERFIILDAVEVHCDDTWGVLTIQGPTAAAVVTQCLPAITGELPTAPLTLLGAISSDLFAVVNDRCDMGGYDLWTPTESVAECVAAAVGHGAVAATRETLEGVRVAAGVARFGIDASDKNFPPESGWGDAVSYDKGCYTGQEVVARIRTYGHVNRQLRRLRMAGELLPPPVGAEVRDGEAKVVGSVTSSAAIDGGAVALAYVKNHCAEPGTTVVVCAGDEEISACVEALAAGS